MPLAVRHHGRVEAVFSSVVYVSLETGMLCIVRRGVDPGPFSVLTSAPGTADLKTLGLAADQAVLATNRRIAVPGSLDVDLRPALNWLPEAWPERPCPYLIAQGLYRLRQCLPASVCRTGLGGFAVGGHRPKDDDLVGRKARAPVLAAGEYLSASGSEQWSACRWARSLIGLGPGLTPSGDDFLCGFMIALHAIGKRDTVRRLWATIREDARTSTNTISLAMLEAAAEGRGCASLHTAICAIMSGLSPAAAVSGLSRFGHSSGWDSLAGVVVVMESMLKRREAAA